MLQRVDEFCDLGVLSESTGVFLNVDRAALVRVNQLKYLVQHLLRLLHGRLKLLQSTRSAIAVGAQQCLNSETQFVLANRTVVILVKRLERRYLRMQVSEA